MIANRMKCTSGYNCFYIAMHSNFLFKCMKDATNTNTTDKNQGCYNEISWEKLKMQFLYQNASLEPFPNSYIFCGSIF